MLRLSRVAVQAHSKYCAELVADYLTRVAELRLDPCSHAAFHALQDGLHALLGACSPFELQQLHVRLSAGLGGVRQAMLAQLREHYESSRYTGQV